MGRKDCSQAKPHCSELQEFRIQRNALALLCGTFSTSWPANHSTWDLPATVSLLQVHASEIGLRELGVTLCIYFVVERKFLRNNYI